MPKLPVLIRRIVRFLFSETSIPLALAWLAAGGYLLTVPYLGYYWDDWSFAWVSQVLGQAGLARYFSTNRPLWGLIFQLTTPWIGEEPWRWQIFGLFWRTASVLALWWALRQIWRREPAAAAWIGFLFAVYPGFSQQPIAITYGHFFIVLTAYFLSLGWMVKGFRLGRAGKRAGAIGCTLPALLLSLVNLVTMEYFFMLDLLRPLLLWAALKDETEEETLTARPLSGYLRLVGWGWLPYLLLFAGVMVWRLFFFPYQTHNYEPVVLHALRDAPLAAGFQLIKKVLSEIWITTFAAWGNVFLLPGPARLGARTTILYAATVIFSFLLSLGFSLPLRSAAKKVSRGWRLTALGGAAILLGGVPFWLTDLPVGLAFPNDRFTLPFALGVSLLFAGILRVLPFKNWQKAILISLMVSLAVGRHFQVATAYRRDWNIQRALFWQMSWRMPGIQPGTTILSNDWKNRFSSDNSLTSPLNWIYAPHNRSGQMSYMFYFPEVRLGLGLKSFEKGLPIEQDYLAATFSGSTSQVIVIYYSPEACLRVIDPQIEAENWMIPPLMRQAAVLTNPEIILPQPAEGAAVLPESIFGEELPHGWCYYFEKADLARQQGDWAEVAALGDTAFTLDDNPNDPVERLVFIEGYAHVGNWQRALELTDDSLRITPAMQPLLCRLWDRIQAETPASAEKDGALEQSGQRLGCQ